MLRGPRCVASCISGRLKQEHGDIAQSCVCVCVLIAHTQAASAEGSDRTFERVAEYLPMEVPSARTIRRLTAFDGERGCFSLPCLWDNKGKCGERV